MTQIDPAELVPRVIAGERSAIAKAITLVESSRSVDRPHADALLAALTPEVGATHRIGITGVPGVGKSTLIERLGLDLVEAGRRVAVLAVDPSSSRSGGSIMGDKTRMAKLSVEPRAFVRPSPTSGALGGVARHTRETITVVEAAGFDTVLVETVGVGQSEVMVADMVDTFVVLALAGAGDELQGIKRGILELCDVLAITKADGDTAEPARLAAARYRRALELMPARHQGWTPSVLTCSALTGDGMDELRDALSEHRTALEGSGEWTTQRATQRVHWMDAAITDGLRRALAEHPAAQTRRTDLAQAVRDGTMSPDLAAAQVLAVLWGDG